MRAARRRRNVVRLMGIGNGRRLGRRVGATAILIVLVAAAIGVTSAVLRRPRVVTPAPPVTTGTAPVTRGAVTELVQVAGVLGFDGSYHVAHQGSPGILTSVAEPGTVVARGAVLYTVADQPARLLFGMVPAYRDFANGMADGPDVRQMEENLVALGLDPGRQVRVDTRFTTATAAAIRRWQSGWGLPADQRTGALPLGAVVFAPVPLRVGQVHAVFATMVGPNEPVLTATSTTRVVTAALTTARQSLVHVGDTVRVSISGIRDAVTGTVARIGRVAESTGGDGQDGERDEATVTVTVRVELPAGTSDLDQAPAQVAVTTATRENVLLVPVVALLPRAGGGYQVRLASGGFVQVRPGLFDSNAGTVEVTGELTEGQLVEVPAG